MGALLEILAPQRRGCSSKEPQPAG